MSLAESQIIERDTEDEQPGYPLERTRRGRPMLKVTLSKIREQAALLKDEDRAKVLDFIMKIQEEALTPIPEETED